MNKLNFIAIILVIPVLGFASTQYVIKPDFKDIPLPEGGVKVVPLSELHISDAMKQQERAKLLEQKKYGFFKIESAAPRAMLSLRQSAFMEIKANANNKDPQDTHLKKSISEIKLAFPFKGSHIKQENVLGYAPAGMWKEGWSGIVQVFNDTKLGVCSYTLNNMSLTQGAVLISEEHVRYDVNKKPTTVNVEGSSHSGFDYAVRWADKTFTYDLECANMNYSKEITSSMIELAKKIDIQNNS